LVLWGASDWRPRGKREATCAARGSPREWGDCVHADRTRWTRAEPTMSERVARLECERRREVGATKGRVAGERASRERAASERRVAEAGATARRSSSGARGSRTSGSSSDTPCRAARKVQRRRPRCQLCLQVAPACKEGHSDPRKGRERDLVSPATQQSRTQRGRHPKISAAARVRSSPCLSSSGPVSTAPSTQSERRTESARASSQLWCPCSSRAAQLRGCRRLLEYGS
jgi:hypothetical protein